MDIVYVLLAIAILLLIYQLAFNKDRDRLDANGNPIYAKKRR